MTPTSFRRRRWEIAPPAPPSHIARFSDLHPLLVQVLYTLGFTDPSDVLAFLNHEEGECNLFALEGMTAAVTRLRQALQAGEPIVVHGDFDADGVTATALLVQALRAFGGQVRPYIPRCADEGRGLHKKVLTQFAHSGTRVVVTVGCGVHSLEEVAHAKQLGLDIIITDNHSVGPQLPGAIAVIDPRRVDSYYPFRELAGVGVAYKLAQALLRSHYQRPVVVLDVSLEEEDLLDLVALGTVASRAPLLGENRALVHRGLVCLNCMERPGIKALCRQADLQLGRVDAAAVGYALAPRLNAAGRIAHAKTAYQLLDTIYPAEAECLANELSQLNRNRQQLTLKTQEQARQLALQGSDDAPLLFAASPDFSAGVVDLVASRLVDEFYRPAVVVELKKEVSCGSACSIPEFHIAEAFDKCADLLTQHRGHATTVDFTIATDNLEELAHRLQELAINQLTGVELIPTMSVAAEIELSQISWDLQQELSRLEPCGRANPRPLLLSRDVRVAGRRAVGSDGKHLKLTLSDDRSAWDAIAFQQGEWVNKLPDHIDLVYHLEVNEWNNQRRLQLNVQDIQPASGDYDIARLWLGLDELGEK